MISKINALPGPLKAVVWLNLVIAALAGIGGIATLTSPKLMDAIVSLATAGISILVVLGILQRSKLVRMLILIFGWLGIALYGFSGVIAIFTIGLMAVAVLIPLGVNVLTVWGLMAASSREYFSGGAQAPVVQHRY